MDSAGVLTDAFGRVREIVMATLDELTVEDLHVRLDGQANSIAWLIWHLTRVQDDHVADAAASSQVWIGQGWVERFGLSLPVESTGFAHTSDEVDAVRVDSPELLAGYQDAVYERAVDFVRGLTDADLDRIVDHGWSPPVTLGVRLVSVIGDTMQHAGQAAFVRGVLGRRAS